MAITISLSVNRTSGKLPLGVVFDASGTTAGGYSRPYHQLFYVWDFGDTGAGSYAYGNSYLTSRNAAYGPVAAHVYYSAGTYTVTLRVYALDGSFATHSSTTITVTDYANSDTICVQNGGDSSFTTADSLFPGCSHVTTSSWNTILGTHVATNKRILLFGDDVFSSSGPTFPNVSNCYIGTYPVNSNKAIVQCSSASGNAITVIDNGSDVRFVDLEFDLQSKANIAFKTSASNFDNIMFARIHAHNGGGAIEWALDTSSAVTDGFYLADSVLEHFTDGASAPGRHALLVGAKNAAVLGNKFDDSTFSSEHLVRLQYLHIAAVQHNAFSNCADTKEMLALRSPPSADTMASNGSQYFGGLGLSGTSAETRRVVVSDNDYTCNVGECHKLGTVKPADDQFGMRDVIVEREYIRQAGTGDFNAVKVDASIAGGNSCYDITLRDNLLRYTDGEENPFEVGNGGSVANTNIDIICNSIASTTSNNATIACVRFLSVSGTGQVKNNVYYAPNLTAPTFGVGSGATFAANSTSGSGGQAKNNNPWTTSPPTTAAHFILNTGVYAIAAGDETVYSFMDYRGIIRDFANMDMGAMAATVGELPGDEPPPVASSPPIARRLIGLTWTP